MNNHNNYNLKITEKSNFRNSLVSHKKAKTSSNKILRISKNKTATKPSHSRIEWQVVKLFGCEMSDFLANIRFYAYRLRHTERIIKFGTKQLQTNPETFYGSSGQNCIRIPKIRLSVRNRRRSGTYKLCHCIIENERKRNVRYRHQENGEI